MKNILSVFIRENQRLKKLVILFVLLCAFSWLSSAIINIPADQPTIQAGIDAAVIGDTVLVQPGTYYENINFEGKDITVASLLLTTGNEDYIHYTIIDGNQNGSVVTLENDETNDAVLTGFTIQNGSGNVWGSGAIGGGIYIYQSSPSLISLNIKYNIAIAGGGIYFISPSHAYIEDVRISKNHAYVTGGGLMINSVFGNSDITFSVDNKCNIYNNSAGFEADVRITDHNTIIQEVIVDTFSVLNPDNNYVSPEQNLELFIDNEWQGRIEQDLYVDPTGNDNNSGLTEDDPLRTIQWALTKIKADEDNPRNIYLAPGIYSPETNGELFALNIRSYVNIIGSGIDETILQGALGNGIFLYGEEDYSHTISNLTIRDNAVVHQSSLSFWDASIDLKNLKVENCANETGNTIACMRNARLNNVFLLNNVGRSPLSISKDFDDNPIVDMNNVKIIGHQPLNGSLGGSGGFLISGAEYVKITNSLVVNNSSFDNEMPKSCIHFGGNQRVDFFNNTIVDNSNTGGTISFSDGGEVNIKNSIIRKGNSQYLFQTRNNDIEPTIVNIEHSNIQGGTNPSIIHMAGVGEYQVEFNWGEGIIDEIPLFVGGDDEYNPLYYQLAEGSPGIDAGIADTTGLFIPPWDLLYNHRVWDGDNNGSAIIDLGCYEYGAPEYVELGEPEIIIPTKIEMSNYPNPFNPSTTISFSLTHSGQVELVVYNIKGQKVKTLIDCYMSPGRNEAVWNGTDDNNNKVSSGIYFYKITAGENSEMKKMVLIK
jgi:hypothetical protein